MEPSATNSPVTSTKQKHRRRGKKKSVETPSASALSNPFLRAIERPLMSANKVISLPQPKPILKDTSLLGLDSEANIRSIHNIVEYTTLDRYSKKFREIEVLFPPSLNILKIQQVFNPFLQLSFQLKRYFFYSNIKPVKLFHCTKLKYVHSICTYNFDWRFNGAEKGHKFGQGVNFTPKPKFAMNFCEKKADVKMMILADVLVMKKQLGNEALKVPSEGYDTTIRKDNITFVKFSDAEFYPSYVIFVCKGKKTL